MDDLDSGTSTLPGEDDTLMENDDLRFVPIPDSRSIGQRDRDLSEVDRVHFFSFYSLLYLFTKIAAKMIIFFQKAVLNFL